MKKFSNKYDPISKPILAWRRQASNACSARKLSPVNERDDRRLSWYNWYKHELIDARDWER